MKKFSFSLQKVLEYNTHIQKKEKDILSVMHAEYYQLEKQVEILISEYELLKIKYLRNCEKGMSISGASQMLIYISEIRKQVQQLKIKMAEKQQLIDKQTIRLVEVTKDKVTVEKLRESKLENYKASERKSDENFIEEFTSYINSVAM